MKLDENPQRVPLASEGAVFRVSVHPGGERLAVGREEGVSLLSLTDFTQLGEPVQLPGDSVEVLRYNQDGLLAVAGLSARELELVSGDSSSDAYPGVSWVSFGGGLMAVSGDRSRVVNLDTNDFPWEQDEPEIESDGCLAALDNAGAHVAAVRTDGSAIELVALADGKAAAIFTGGPETLRWLGFTPDDRYLIALDRYADSMVVWDVESAEVHLPGRFGELASHYWSIACHPDGDHCARGMLSGVLDIVRLSDGEIVSSQRVHEGRVQDLAFTPDGAHLISCGDDGALLRWTLG